MTTICPDCGYENLEGADECEQCHQSLTALSKPRASSLLEKSIFKDRIRTLLPRNPLIVKPDTLVSEVLKLLHQHSVGCVMILDEGELVGIFSERDALMRLNTKASELGDHPISEFMTANPESLETTDKIAFALHKMDLGGYRHIPIRKGDQINGIISVRHILRYITEHLLAAQEATQ